MVLKLEKILKISNNKRTEVTAILKAQVAKLN